MNANQRKNIIILWNGFSESYRNKVKGMIGALENPVETSENTTKNDLIRVLHLREWPGAIALWTRALGPMSRLQLDACSRITSSKYQYSPHLLSVTVRHY